MNLLQEFTDRLGEEEGISAREYRVEVNLFGQFLRDCPNIRPEVDDLRDAYQAWLECGSGLPEAEWSNHLYLVCLFVEKRKQEAEEN